MFCSQLLLTQNPAHQNVVFIVYFKQQHVFLECMWLHKFTLLRAKVMLDSVGLFESIIQDAFIASTTTSGPVAVALAEP